MIDDPLATMGLDSGADEKAIRSRYLELIKKHSPDRDPQRFREIRQAYEALRDPVTQVELRLFKTATDDSLEHVISDVSRRITDQRLPVETLLELSEIR